MGLFSRRRNVHYNNENKQTRRFGGLLNGYYRTTFSDLFASDALYRRREDSACSITLNTKQGSRWYHF